MRQTKLGPTQPQALLVVPAVAADTCAKELFRIVPFCPLLRRFCFHFIYGGQLKPSKNMCRGSTKVSFFGHVASSRGWTEPKPKLWAKTKIGSCSIRKQEIPAYRQQLSGRKQGEYILPVHLFKKWKVKVKAKEYSSCFLPENCNRYAGISCILIEQEPILVFAQSFGFGSVQPLICLPVWQYDVHQFWLDLYCIGSWCVVNGFYIIWFECIYFWNKMQTSTISYRNGSK